MNNFQLNISENFKKNYKNRIVQLVLLIIAMEVLIFPIPGAALDAQILNDKSLETELKDSPKIVKFIETPVVLANNEENSIAINTEDTTKREVAWTKRYAMTAYNSLPGQTDDSPCITANGFNVCEHGIEDTVAANFLKFGTEIRIPELFGDRIFVVRDRMNKRYSDRVDVWLLSYDNAVDFGVKYPLIEVLK